MGREVRMVPKDWKHPTDYRGKYIPLHGGSYAERAREWHEEYMKFVEGYKRDYVNGGWEPYDGECKYYWEYAGPPPDGNDFMPDFEQRTHYMMYEDTSEGTPISPAFETPEALARWLADNGASACGYMKATYEQWLATIEVGSAVSGVYANGKMQSGVAYNENPN